MSTTTEEIDAILGNKPWGDVEPKVAIVDECIEILALPWEAEGSILDEWEERFGDRDVMLLTREEILGLDIDDLRLWVSCVGYVLAFCWRDSGSGIGDIMHQILD